MPEIGVRVNGGPISLWVDCAPEDPQSALLETLRDPVHHAEEAVADSRREGANATN